jgi:hypothetical protein
MDGGGGSNEDDLTIKLQEIISMNNTLRLALTKGASTRMLMENWDFLQVRGCGVRAWGIGSCVCVCRGVSLRVRCRATAS